jgi:hypothetical protein
MTINELKKAYSLAIGVASHQRDIAILRTSKAIDIATEGACAYCQIRLPAEEIGDAIIACLERAAARFRARLILKE